MKIQEKSQKIISSMNLDLRLSEFYIYCFLHQPLFSLVAAYLTYYCKSTSCNLSYMAILPH